jgi:hypothetical protein
MTFLRGFYGLFPMTRFLFTHRTVAHRSFVL